MGDLAEDEEEHLAKTFRFLYVIVWIKARLGEHKKNVFGREDYIIRRTFKG